MKKKQLVKKDNVELVNWKSVGLLREFTTRFGNIKPRRFTTLPVKYQKRVRKAIINAREFGLIPYIK